MDSNQVQTPTNKNSQEFVNRAADIIIRLSEQVDKCCPRCKELLKESLQN